MDEGISSRPTTDSGRRMTNEELGMTPGGVDPVSKPKAKPVGPSSAAVSKVLAGMAKKNSGMGAMSDRDMQMAKAAMKKGVPSYSDRPVVRRKTGGLMAMPKGKC